MVDDYKFLTTVLVIYNMFLGAIFTIMVIKC